MGKGPEVFLVNLSTQNRQAYNIAIQKRDYFAAADAIISMASGLPKQANYKVPDPPEVLFTPQHIDQPKEIEVKKWCLKEHARVEQAYREYVYDFRKNWDGGVNL